MTKTYIKSALKNNNVKGFSKAVISLETGCVTVGNYCGKIDESNILYLKPIDKNDTKSGHLVIQL